MAPPRDPPLISPGEPDLVAAPDVPPGDTQVVAPADPHPDVPHPDAGPSPLNQEALQSVREAAFLALREGDPTRAIAMLEEALGRTDDPQLRTTLGLAYEAARDYCAARDTYSTALTQQPANPWLLQKRDENHGLCIQGSP